MLDYDDHEIEKGYQSAALMSLAWINKNTEKSLCFVGGRIRYFCNLILTLLNPNKTQKII